MRNYIIYPLACLLSFTACRSEEDKKADQRALALKKDLVTLYTEAVPSFTDKPTQTLAQVALANALSKSKKSKDATKLLDSAFANYETEKPSEDVNKGLRLIASAYLKSNAPDSMTPVLQRLPASQIKDELLQDLIAYYAQNKQDKKIDALLSDLSGSEAKEEAHKRLCFVKIENGKVDQALKDTESFKNKSLAPEVFLKAIEKRIKQSRLKDARRLLDSMEGGTARNKAKGALALALFHKHQTEEAQKLMDGIESIWIRAATRAKRSNALYNARSYKKARVLAEKAIAEINEISEPAVKEAAVEDLVTIFVKYRRTREALELARFAKTKEGLVAVHSDLIETYARAGRFDETAKLLPTLLQTPMWGAKGVGRLAIAYADKGQYADSLSTASKIAIMEFRLPVVAEIAVKHSLGAKKMTSEELDAFEAGFKPPVY